MNVAEYKALLAGENKQTPPKDGVCSFCGGVCWIHKAIPPDFVDTKTCIACGELDTSVKKKKEKRR